MKFTGISITHLRSLNISDGVAFDTRRVDILNCKVTPIGDGINIILAFCLVLVILKIFNEILKRRRINKVFSKNKYK